MQEDTEKGQIQNMGGGPEEAGKAGMQWVWNRALWAAPGARASNSVQREAREGFYFHLFIYLRESTGEGGAERETES